MADPSAIASSISTYRLDLEPALADQGPEFFAQVDQLYSQVLSGPGDQVSQDRAGDQLLALVRQHAAADQLLRRVDPGTFGPPAGAGPRVDPAAVRAVPATAGPLVDAGQSPPAVAATAPPVAASPPTPPVTIFTPAAGGSDGQTGHAAQASNGTPAGPPAPQAVSLTLPPVQPASGANGSAAPPAVKLAPPALAGDAPHPAGDVPATVQPPAAPENAADRSLASATSGRGGGVLGGLFAAGGNEVGMLSTGLLGVLKELVAALLGVVLVLGTVAIAFIAVLAGLLGKGSDFQAAKDVLLLMTSLAGVVLGYYYGRIPSEARADQAQQTATKAQADTAQAQSQVQVVRDQAAQLADQVGDLAASVQAAPPPSATRSLDPGQAAAQADIQRSQAEKLRQVQQALRDLARNNRP